MDSISIIAPTYNRGFIIENTIKSLLSINYSDYEVIVVDDGSTDDTEEIIKGIDSSRLRYYKKENGERAAARNYGTNLANGAYINFVDSDDTVYPNHLVEAQKAVWVHQNPEVFHLAYDIKDSEGNILRVVDHFPSTINEELINGNHLSCNGVFIRRDIALKYPFNENRTLSGSEDYELWLRLASRFPIHCINTVTSTVINHEARSVVLINKETFISRIELLKSEIKKDAMFFKNYGHQLDVFEAYLDIYMALHLAMAKYPKKDSLRYLVRAFNLRPSSVFSRRFLAVLKKIVL